MKLGVIIPAAGSGTRMQSHLNKQFLNLRGLPVLAHTINLFFSCPLVAEIVVVVRASELAFCQQEIIKKFFNNSIKLVAGGKIRRESVFAGLKSFSPAINYVLIHDGARPLLPKTIITKTVEAVQKYQAVTVGVNIKDTIKRINEDKTVVETLRRRELISIQTPQAFTYKLILKAHQQVLNTDIITDDASLVEALPFPVKVIAGSYENIKLTTPWDLSLAELILEKRKKDD